MIKFEKDFLWGGAMSAEQSEGHGDTNKGLTIWDYHFKKAPHEFYGKIGPNLASNYFTNHKEDAKLFKKTGSNSIRISISWPRLFPDGENINEKAVKFYHEVLDNLIKEGIKPLVNLFHFDMPLWAFKIGGWTNKKVILSFKNFAKFAFEEYGHKVDYFITFNEPIVPVIAGYQGTGQWLPQITDNKRTVEELFGIILAHAHAVKAFKEVDNKNSKIGIIVNISPAYPKDAINFTDLDKQAADNFNLLHNYAILDPMIKGTFPKELKPLLLELDLMIDIKQEDLDIIKQVKVDFLGVNYYSPARVEAITKEGQSIGSKLYKTYKWEKARMNVFRGWEIYPKGIYDTAMIVKNRYNNMSFFVSENGMGVENEGRFRRQNGMIEDDYRIAFVKEHLEFLHKAISEGANCFGYHMWTIMDNWSWRNAYKNRYGFIEVDLKTQERKLKKSALWFNDFTSTNTFDTNYPKVDEVIDLKNQEYKESV